MSNGQACCAITSGFLCCVGLLLTVILVPLSMKRVDEGDVGLRYDNLPNKLYSEPLEPALHTLRPDTVVFTYPTRFETFDINDFTVMTSDGATVQVDVSVQYTVDTTKLVESITTYGKLKRVVNYIILHAKRALYETAVTIPAIEFTENRGAVEFNFSSAIGASMTVNESSSFTIIGQFQFRNFVYQADFQKAVNAKQQTKQRIQIVENEREAIITSAETELQKTIKAVEIQLNDAIARQDTLVAEANQNKEAILERWNQQAISTAKELDNLGYRQTVYNSTTNTSNVVVDFESYIVYKFKTLPGESNNAIVNVNKL